MLYVILVNAKPSYWYDTLYSYFIGTCYSLYKEEIENIIKKNYAVYLSLFIFVFAILMILPFNLKGGMAIMRAIFLSLTIVLLSMKVKIHSKSLSWLGQNLFPLYIYQRIGMILLSKFDGGMFISEYPYLYILSCAVITLLLGWSYKFIQIKY